MGLNKKQLEAYQHICKGSNVFISGPGGVGKSFLINYLREQFAKDTIFLAPTGVAALNIKGSTIHSVFKLSTHVLTANMCKRSPHKDVIDLFEGNAVKRIVIDEISMVRSDVFTAIDQTLRRVKRRNVAFGGIQVIIFGDFYQIPPVLTKYDNAVFYEDYTSPFCFSTESYSSCNFEYVELDEVVRQTNKEMIDNLQSIRQQDSDFRNAVKWFNTNCSPIEKLIEEDPVVLCTTNALAVAQNKDRYDEIDAEEHVFNAKIKGNFDDVEPAPRQLKVKVGMKVMMTANDATAGYVNGSVGYVVKVTPSSIHVMLDPDGYVVVVRPFTWTQYSYVNVGGQVDTNVAGTYTQFPIKIGYAITIHKSQGQTLDYALIDFGRGCFASGQAYVALSRVKTIEGISFVSGFSPSDVIVDSDIKKFYNNGCRGTLSAI